jgi:hypothetical protein
MHIARRPPLPHTPTPACAAAAKKTREISGSGLSNDIATCDVLLPKVGTAAVAASTGAADDFNHALARFMTPPYT